MTGFPGAVGVVEGTARVLRRPEDGAGSVTARSS